MLFASLTAFALAAPPDFAKDVRPILEKHCFSCHDARKGTADFRIDLKARAVKGGESGKAGIVAGQSAASEIFRRVSTADDDVVMPPKKRLSAEQIATLKAWIDAGAAWPEALSGADARLAHWAFQPPVKAKLPGDSGHAIDRFIRARLVKDGWRQSPEADKITLLRRLTLDLTGLPPTPTEIDVFLADRTTDAYAKQVDRLLASPHYGERWGRVWLDAARYADSDGFEKDKPRQVWFYRDYVINALNRDLPYDRFITEQLAGDLLPSATQDQRVATGFLRNSMINEEGGIDPEQFRMEAMFDRVEAVGKGILGLTVQCAQCHSHKFDPISHTEYYRLFAYLNNDYEANPAVYTPVEQKQRDDLQRKIAEIEAGLRQRTPDWRAKLHTWEDTVKGKQPTWRVLRPEAEHNSTGGQRYLPQADGSMLCLGYAPTKHTVRLTAPNDLKGITAFRLELLPDPNLPCGGPGRSVKGTGALTEFRAEADGKALKFTKATADVNPPERPLEAIHDDKSGKKRVTGPVSFALDGKDETAWGFDRGPGRRNGPHQAVFTLDKSTDAAKTLVVFLAQNHGGWNSDDNMNLNLGRVRLSVTDAANAEADPLPANVRALVEKPRDQRTPADDEAIFRHWRTTVKEWQPENDAIEKLWQQHPEGATQLVLQTGQARPTHLLKRGDFLKPAEAVTPGVPALLNPLPADAAPSRLTLARWLTDRRAPTTARAIVNRVWQSYFGTGFVTSSEDLGTQCAPPSHPELLDWLAADFMDQGWSLKKLHRQIVTSATYRQSSKVTPEQVAVDPENRLLARGPRFRTDAETVRDIALAASGLLNAKVGGRSVFPPLPEWMLKPPVSYGPKSWPEDKGAERYRRSLYIFRYRSQPYPVLQTFDAPNGDAACVRRPRSNTPLQALMTLNEPVFVECAKALGELAQKEGGATDEAKIAFAFRRCVSRAPTDTEAKVLLKLLRQSGSDGWAVVARVLLNLDETITKE